jgi:predicted DNA-binding protein YlxM (UPF0122 family)
LKEGNFVNSETAVEKAERIVMLLDFYGDLLTDRQRYYMQCYYHDDLSLSEIAAHEGVTRQAIRDMLSRSVKLLEDYEEKVGACKRHVFAADIIKALEDSLVDVHELNKNKFQNRRLLELTNKMYDTIQKLKD